MFSAVSVSADYDIPSKYQKTEFNSSKWIQSYHNLSFSDFVILDTYFINAYENLSDYYLYDEVPGVQNYISLHNDTYATSYVNDNDETNYLRYNNSDNPTSVFNLYFWFKYDSTVNAAQSHMMTFGNEENGFRDIIVNGTECVSIRIRRLESDPKRTHIILLHKTNNTYAFEDAINVINFNQWYYCNFYRYNKNVTLNMFTDKGMTNRVIHLTYGNLNADETYDYFYPISTHDNGVSGKDLDFDIKNLIDNETLNREIYFNTGLLYTKDLLENSTEKSVMIGFNSTAYIDTVTSLYVSDDNATWKILLQNDGLGSLSQYCEILYNYSSLYARLNLTTNDPLVTPFVDELFYFHTYECAVSDETKPYVFITLFTIIGIILGYAIDRT